MCFDSVVSAKAFLVNVATSFRSQVLFICYFVQFMWLYLSEHEEFNDFGREDALVWHETNIPFSVWGPESTRSLSLTYYPSEVRMIGNVTGTLYLI